MIHSQRLERWLGADKVEELSRSMKGWYGRPITLLDVPGGVQVRSDGDFQGNFGQGYFGSALDVLEAKIKRAWRNAGRVRHGQMNVGFASISDALSRSSQGYAQRMQIIKTGATGVAAITNTLWRAGAQPAAGAAGSAAPGGRACDRTTTGALGQVNPSAGTLHLIGADMCATVANNCLLVYDRLFDVAKTMNSTATEAVSGVPGRYTSTTATDPDYAGDNFLFIEVGATALAATAHNWTVCTYTNAAGTAAQTLPSVTGVASAISDRFDMTAGWFAPLATGDVGIKALTQMQCSALVATGSINFVIGHPLGFMTLPVANMIFPFDWLTNRDLAPRVFDSACLAFLELTKPSATATTYSGRLALLNASA